MRALFSFFESDLNSSIAAFTVAGSGTEAGTIAEEGKGDEEDEEGTTTAAREEMLMAEARISNTKSKNDRFIVVDLSLVI